MAGNPFTKETLLIQTDTLLFLFFFSFFKCWGSNPEPSIHARSRSLTLGVLPFTKPSAPTTLITIPLVWEQTSGETVSFICITYCPGYGNLVTNFPKVRKIQRTVSDSNISAPILTEMEGNWRCEAFWRTWSTSSSEVNRYLHITCLRTNSVTRRDFSCLRSCKKYIMTQRALEWNSQTGNIYILHSLSAHTPLPTPKKQSKII